MVRYLFESLSRIAEQLQDPELFPRMSSVSRRAFGRLAAAVVFGGLTGPGLRRVYADSACECNLSGTCADSCVPNWTCPGWAKLPDHQNCWCEDDGDVTELKCDCLCDSGACACATIDSPLCKTGGGRGPGDLY